MNALIVELPAKAQLAGAHACKTSLLGVPYIPLPLAGGAVGDFIGELSIWVSAAGFLTAFFFLCTAATCCFFLAFAFAFTGFAAGSAGCEALVSGLAVWAMEPVLSSAEPAIVAAIAQRVTSFMSLSPV